MTPERTWIEVDLSALLDNARTLAARAGGARLLPMVKANAYGLGAVPVARALERLDPWGYGVATAAEGEELRQAGIERPVLVFAPTVGAMEALAAADLRPVLGSLPQLERWTAVAPGRPFHAEVDTGMARAGFHWQDFQSIAGRLEATPGFEGICTHFHSWGADSDSIAAQRELFAAALRCLRTRPALVHAANSAGALVYPVEGEDLVRPGIYLYGGALPGWKAKPVVAWRSRVVDSRWREPGSTVSYGATYTVQRRTCLVTIAAGYADGFPRSLSNAGAALLGGRRVPIAGRVTMDMTVLDVGENEPAPDSVATLIGADGSEAITVEEVASAAGTISYEILTGISPRVERVYL